MHDSAKRSRALIAGLSFGSRLAVTITTSTVIAESLMWLGMFKVVQIKPVAKIATPIPIGWNGRNYRYTALVMAPIAEPITLSEAEVVVSLRLS